MIIPVRVRNGVPQCPEGCGDMAENADGLWSCPLGDMQWDYVRRVMSEMVHEMLDVTP